MSTTRNAVETAIDLAKGDIRSTWEGQVKTVLSHIPQWEEEHNSVVQKKKNALTRQDGPCGHRDAGR